jgi:hypothetical protein
MKTFSFLLSSFSAVLLLIMAVSAAPLTMAEEANMNGKWILKRPGWQRLYEISSGRSLRIEGGGLKDRNERMSVQADGSYLAKLDAGTHLKLRYTPANDELIVAFYNKKDLELGLPPKWTAKATRKKD